MSFTSFIQRLTRSPRKSKSLTTRQDSIESAFARVESRNASKDLSTTPSLTPAASQTDTSSEPTEVSEDIEITVGSSKSQAASKYLDTYPPPPYQVHESEHTKATNTEDNEALRVAHLTKDESDSGEVLLQEGVQALNAEWDIGSMPGDNLQLSSTAPEPTRRKSTRLGIMDRASEILDQTASILGKRRRASPETGLANLRAVKEDKEKTESHSPHRRKKQARVSLGIEHGDTLAESELDPLPPKKRHKTWLSQGLYAGQDIDSKPKLTGPKNAKKEASVIQHDSQRPKFMPLPMFAGARRLERGEDFQLPYNVYGPLPSNQPRPESWKTTSKSKLLISICKVSHADCDYRCFCWGCRRLVEENQSARSFTVYLSQRV